MKSKTTKPVTAMSVVIPAYNAAEWLPRTVPKVETALKNAGVKTAEIIIVDDGSSDNTSTVAKALKTHYPIKVFRQPNGGRFLAREFGTKKITYDHALFIDTRVFIAPNALKFVLGEIAKHPERQIWTSHVNLEKKSNIYARFWFVVASLAWRKYFAHPRDYSYGIDEFDKFPKGTTCFFVPTAVIKEANEWFVANTKNLKTANDDTLLIRHMAEQQNININPEYSCVYHARPTLKSESKHVFHRGKVLVDGFLRRDGNWLFWPIVAFLILSVAVPVGLVTMPQFILPLLVFGLLLWLLEVPICMLLGIPFEDAWGLTILTPLFSVIYGAGIWTAFIKIYILRKP